MSAPLPAAQVQDLLQALRDAASPGDIDQAAMHRRLVTIQGNVDDVLAAFRVSARRPDLPSLIEPVMKAATGNLREFDQQARIEAAGKPTRWPAIEVPPPHECDASCTTTVEGDDK